MDDPKVIIVVKNGAVADVIADCQLKYVIIDYDAMGRGEDFPVGIDDYASQVSNIYSELYNQDKIFYRHGNT